MSVQKDLAKAKSLMKKGQHKDAREYYFRVLAKYPANKTAIEALNRLGGANNTPEDQKLATDLNRVIAVYKKNQIDEALEMLAKVESSQPEHPEILNLKGVILSKGQRYEEAVACYERCLELNPGQIGAVVNLGKALVSDGKIEAGIDRYKKAIALQPMNQALKGRLASALKTIGRKVEAQAVLEKALRLEPDNIDLLIQLSRMRKIKQGDPLLNHMLRLAKKPDLTKAQQRAIHFALGSAFDSVGEHEKAHQAFVAGNKARRLLLTYEVQEDRLLFDTIKKAFQQPLNPLDVSDSDIRPIFVVGMPRSGTTLLEQILGSHSKGQGAGEVGWFSRTIKPEFRKLSGSAEDNYPEARLQEVRTSYLEALEKLSHGAANVVDKMPTNFRWIGLMAAAFPDAPILHIRRDPRATCWSIFRQNFASTGNKYAFDLDETVEFYGLYVELMAFWHDLLPGRILDISYEALTREPEQEVRGILEHCGLEWEPSVLDFHKEKKAVWTASVDQVRKKIYTGSSEEWRKYAPFVGTAFDQLEVRDLSS